MAFCKDCGEKYPDKRAELGYERCIDCAVLNPEKPSVFIVDVNKSNPTITSNSDAVCILPNRPGGSVGKTTDYKRMMLTFIQN